MNSPLILLPWLLMALPVVSFVEWSQLRDKSKTDYAHFVAWKHFPIWKISVGKLIFFSLLGAGSMAYSVTFDRMVLALTSIGICGFLLEDSFASGRPMPTPEYRYARTACHNCSLSQHQRCTNLRMLDSFETRFRARGGTRRPVCCCGFRLGEWKEIES